jgi:plasmid stability protein
MAQILIRNLSKKTVTGLKRNAKAHKRSLQAEAKLTLDDAVAYSVKMERARKSIDRLRRMFEGRTFPDSAELIREDRDR